MLTLGLMEGVLSATLGFLVLMMAAGENAPLHRIFGPLVTVTLGFAAYLIHDSAAVTRGADLAGLAFFALLAFFVPLGIMRAAWKSIRDLEAKPAEPVARTRPAAAPQPARPRGEAAPGAPERRVA